VLFEYAATLGLLDVDHVPAAHARDDFRQMWGTDRIDAPSRYDGLRAVRLTALGACAAGLTTTYTPAARTRPDHTLQVLANHHIVATADLAPADRLVLDAFTTRTCDRVWTLSTTSLLAAVHAGRAPAELGALLDEHAVHAVPATVHTLLADLETRAGQIRDLGTHRVLECADPSVATLLAQDRSPRGLCIRLGERHLMLDPAGEPKARAALRKLGYPVGPPSR
jgi:hypothetical protein